MAGFFVQSAADKKWRWRWSFPLLVIALAALFLSGRGAFSTPDNVHEAVFSWARQHPGESVPVILQTSGETDGLVSRIGESGGEVERELSLIQALDASLPAGEIGSIAGDPAVSSVSLDAAIVPTTFVDTTNLVSAYPFAVNAPAVWNGATSVTGQGVGVAVIDTGVTSAGNTDFADAAGASRVTDVKIAAAATSAADGFGHGTHVAGIVGGDGDMAAGRYIGIAPEASIFNVKIADDLGGATLADVIAGIQWTVDNMYTHNIRVLNLSLRSSVAESYKTDPLDAAVEFAWARGLVVVVSSGNDGTVDCAVCYAPSNDPFIIVVGATDDFGTATRDDDVIAFFTSRGRTQDGFEKPDIYAPGRRIVSDLSPNSVLALTYPDRITDQFYLRLSGTSMASPVVAGIAALVLQNNPLLTPGQVKYIFQRTSQQLALDSSAKVALADAAVFFSDVPQDANAQLSPARQLRMSFTAKVGVVAHVLGAADPAAEAALAGIDINHLGGPGTTLANVDWEAIKWNAIKWDAIKWDVIKWDVIKWDAIKWDIIKWDAIKWNVIKWGAIKWDAIKWSVIKWDAIKWDAIKWDALTTGDAVVTGVEFHRSNFDSSKFNSARFNFYTGN